MIKSFGELEEFPVLSIDNKWFILHQITPYSINQFYKMDKCRG